MLDATAATEDVERRREEEPTDSEKAHNEKRHPKHPFDRGLRSVLPIGSVRDNRDPLIGDVALSESPLVVRLLRTAERSRT
jgi:hypothetical protein